jgi:hypothetical protein
MIEFISTSVTLSLNYNLNNAIADFHNFHFIVAHALGLSISTSRLLATDWNLLVRIINSTQPWFNSLNCCVPLYSHSLDVALPESESESESYVTTDGQSASLSWYKAPIRGLRPDFFSVRNTEYV